MKKFRIPVAPSSRLDKKVEPENTNIPLDNSFIIVLKDVASFSVIWSFTVVSVLTLSTIPCAKPGAAIEATAEPTPNIARPAPSTFSCPAASTALRKGRSPIFTRVVTLSRIPCAHPGLLIVSAIA